MQRPLGIYLSRQVAMPAYGTGAAGCLDFFVPEFDSKFFMDLRAKNPWYDQDFFDMCFDTMSLIIDPLHDMCIPSGVHARLEPFTALRAMNKSGVATKLKLIRGAEYVDADYSGEIHLHVMNVGCQRVTITQGQKLVQFEYGPVYRAAIQKYSSKEEMYANLNSERGEKWQGSTGTHAQ